jgi:hypothetical protein
MAALAQRETALLERTYVMRHFELIAPEVRNDGLPSGYPAAVADALDDAGIGWTRAASEGSWHGKRERGVAYTVFSCEDLLARLAVVARACMPDQEAIQLVEYPTVRLVEA